MDGSRKTGLLVRTCAPQEEKFRSDCCAQQHRTLRVSAHMSKAGSFLGNQTAILANDDFPKNLMAWEGDQDGSCLLFFANLAREVFRGFPESTEQLVLQVDCLTACIENGVAC